MELKSRCKGDCRHGERPKKAIQKIQILDIVKYISLLKTDKRRQLPLYRGHNPGLFLKHAMVYLINNTELSWQTEWEQKTQTMVAYINMY